MILLAASPALGQAPGAQSTAPASPASDSIDVRADGTAPTLADRVRLHPRFVGRAIDASSPTAQAPAPSPQAPAIPTQTTPGDPPQAARLTCASQIGDQRRDCAADTSSGVILVRSIGAAPCLLGRTWGYDDKNVWVSDGCSGEFIVARVLEQPATPEKPKPFEHVPNAGFLLYSGDEGEIYFRLFSYARYLNQLSLDSSYTDAFGNVHSVVQRQDMQLVKFFAPFSGWFLTPKFRYYLYVWSANTSQGDPAQVVGAGNLSLLFNRYFTVGAGITSLPAVRSTEGQFPYWLGVDDRLIADEYFRGSYTTGVWAKGEIQTKFKYMVMLANNLSTLGVSAAQLDNNFDTQSYMVQWLPTTGEFGLYGTFGDYDYHEKAATRVGLHFTHSLEERQSQPGTEGIENSQIRLSDGSVIFTPDLFGPGIRVNEVNYQMMSIDAGLKYKGLAFEGEYYRRWLSDYAGLNVDTVPDISDNGYQMQISAMTVKDVLQPYVGWSQIFGDYGDPSEYRIGGNYYFLKKRGLRVNGEFMHVNGSPVGYTAYPYPVGATGNVFHINLEMNF